MTINLKIEVLKIFCLEFSLYSDKELKLRREKPDEKDSAAASPPGKLTNPSK